MDATRMTLGSDMATLRLRYLVRDFSRHGQLRLYVRRKGHAKIRLLVESENDQNFAQAYAAALRGEQWQPPEKSPSDAAAPKKSLPGTVRATSEEYFQSAAFKTLSDRTKYVRRAQIESICRAPVQPDSASTLGDCPLRRFDSSHVRMILDRRAETPEAANNSVKSLSAMFTWAVEAKRCDANPTTGVKRIHTGSEGYHRRVALRGPHLPRHRPRQALHGRWIRQLVSRPMQRGWAAWAVSAWPP
jgi:hypothetical protein